MDLGGSINPQLAIASSREMMTDSARVASSPLAEAMAAS
jgi:hypothetical protein